LNLTIVVSVVVVVSTPAWVAINVTTRGVLKNPSSDAKKPQKNPDWV